MLAQVLEKGGGRGRRTRGEVETSRVARWEKIATSDV